jgi:hypothetical protein
VSEAASGHPGDVIVDVSHVRLLAAAGVTVLAEVAEQLARAGQRMHLVVGDGSVARALRTTARNGGVGMSATLAAASRAVGRAPAPQPPTVQRALVELGELTADADGLRPVLIRLAELACVVVPRVDGASVILGSPTDPELLASSSTWAQSADGVQLVADCGPTWDAHDLGAPVATADVTADGRWPRLARTPESWPPAFRSCVAAPMRRRPAARSGEVLGVLTLYSRDAGTLDELAVRQEAERLAARAAAVTTVSRRLAELTRTQEQLAAALTSRATIDMAKGIVMADKGCSADEAFAVLRQISSMTNRKVRDVAQDVVQRAATS